MKNFTKHLKQWSFAQSSPKHTAKDISVTASLLGKMLRAGLATDEAIRHLDNALPNQWLE